MEFIKPGTNIDFIGKRFICFGISGILILASIITLIIHKGPNYGIDFVGGTIVQVRFEKAVSIDSIKDGLKSMGITGAAVQQFGDPSHHEYLIRTSRALMTDSGFESEIKGAIKKACGVDVDIRRVEMVGPQVGQTLREKALFALFYALLFITIYISGRFEMKWMASAVTAGVLIAVVYFASMFSVSIPILIFAALIVSLLLFWQLQLRFAMGAIVALIHDVTITVGVFSVMDKEFSLPIVAALLTIIGYSLNDTIIVFDRIRENMKKNPRLGLDLTINRSVNETLSRTILTSGTTLLVLLALFFLGGDIIHDFAFAMLIGVVVGTYSSIYVASPVLLALGPAAEPLGTQKAGAAQ